MKVLIDGINYELDSTTHTAVVCKLDDNQKYLGDVVIPATITYTNIFYRVTSMVKCWFGREQNITNMSFSVVRIENEAFAHCSRLSSIIIPNTITSIGERAFDDCTGLTKTNYIGSIADWCRINFTSVSSNPMCYSQNLLINDVLVTDIIIPEGITSISNYVFSCCRSLISVKIPNSVTSIGKRIFSGCRSLTSVTIPSGVTSIEDLTFSGCSSLTAISIPNSVTSIGKSAFSGCRSLTSVTIPSGVTSIGDWTFYGCSSLTSITIPNSVTSIGDCAFADCSSLTSITIPDNIENIENRAFAGCSAIVVIALPKSVTRIGPEVFSRCKKLQTICVPQGMVDRFCNMGLAPYRERIMEKSIDMYPSMCNPLEIHTNSQVVINEIRYNIETATLTASVCQQEDNQKYSGDIVIPANITYNGMIYRVNNISKSAFSHCYDLISITIPHSVTHISNNAFYDCVRLTSIEVEKGNAIYDSRDNCNAIIISATNTLIVGCKNTIIPNTVTSIRGMAFFLRVNLTSIVIPCSVTHIGIGAFSACFELTSIVVDKHNPIYDSRNNCNAVIETVNNTLIAGCGKTIIPNTVTSIGDCAFFGCSFDSIMRIFQHKSSFYNFKTITIPDSVTHIGKQAFQSCSLTTITIPDSVTSIGKDAFSNCKKLATIRIPKGKQSIFDAEDVEDLRHKLIEYIRIDSIEYELGENSSAIVCTQNGKCNNSIVIPTRVEQEGKKYTVNRLDARAFADCEELVSITLPKSITEIGAEVFANCENLQTIRVPQGMTDRFCEMGLEPWRDKIVEPRQEEYTILLNIARGYELGIGMARNPAQAVLLYSQAADKGCAEAAYHLGELYEEGVLLPQDYQQAADWFAKAAALYHPNAATRSLACLRIIEEENARLAEMQQEQQAQLDRLAQSKTTNNQHTPMKTILFFDTETNGLPRDYKASVTNTANWPRLIQLGWIITDEQGNILKQVSRMIYPDFVINEAVTRLTGITTDQARREGTDISEVLPEFIADVENASLLVGHNIDFDRNIVGCELVRMHSDPRTLMTKSTVCTMQRSTNFCAIPSKSSYHTGYKYPTLTELYTKLFGHAFAGAHNALADITATKDCYFELRKRGII